LGETLGQTKETKERACADEVQGKGDRRKVRGEETMDHFNLVNVLKTTENCGVVEVVCLSRSGDQKRKEWNASQSNLTKWVRGKRREEARVPSINTVAVSEAEINNCPLPPPGISGTVKTTKGVEKQLGDPSFGI